MKPHQTSLFLGLVFLGLMILSLILPSKIQVFGIFTFSTPSVKSLFGTSVSPINIQPILIKSKIYKDSIQNKSTIPVAVSLDSLNDADFARKPDDLPNKFEVGEVMEEINFTDESKSCFQSFFGLLANAQNQKVHILHFGDSQIETDHVTSYIRNSLQQKFGGFGIGLMPIVTPGGTCALDKRISGNWKRYTLYGKPDTSLKHHKFGILYSLSRILPSKKSEEYKAGFEIVQNGFVNQRSRIFQEIKLFCSPVQPKLNIDFFVDKKRIANQDVELSENLNIISQSFEKPLDRIKVEFNTTESPDFYGFSLESKTGVLVSNISMRGSRGLDFTLNDISLVSEFIRKLNVKMLIFQFGNNVVITANSTTNYERYYENQFYNQLRTFRTLFPEIPIVVIGTADIAMKEDENFVSYPNIRKVLQAQKNAATRAGCAFWDLFSAMGGENSMASWVNNDPPLAQKDYVHFSAEGAKVIGEMFTNALLSAYQKSLNQKTRQN